MILFVDKLITQAKLVRIYCIMKTLEYRNCLGGGKYAKFWLLIQGLTVDVCPQPKLNTFTNMNFFCDRKLGLISQLLKTQRQ